MSTSDSDLDPTNESSQDQVTPEDGSAIGKLTVEDDPEGTVDPAELAGTASDDDADVS